MQAVAQALPEVIQAVEVSVPEASHPGAGPELGDLAKVEVLVGVDRLAALVDDLVEDERLGAQPVLEHILQNFFFLRR